MQPPRSPQSRPDRRPRRAGAVVLTAAVLASTAGTGLGAVAHAQDAPAPLPVTVPGLTDAAARGGDVAAVVVDERGRPSVVPVVARTAQEAAQKAEAVPGSEGVVVDTPVRATAVDTHRSQQWHLDALRTDEIPASTAPSNREQVVAVLDTGVRASHEDFAPGQVLCDQGASFTGEPGAHACTDLHGHGTHVAGIVAATSGNGRGVASVASGTSILPVQVLGASGGGSSFGVFQGILWAADHGADVINMSLAGPYSSAYDEAVEYATRRGVLVVAAAGNNRQSGNATQWPAASPGALSVAATTPAGTSASFSHSGPTVDVAAPGTGIVSLGAGSDAGYVGMSGTSMAAPVVAGIASLHRAAHPSATPQQVTDAILGTARDVEAAGRDHATGHGVVDAHALLVGSAVVLRAPAVPSGVRATGGDASLTLTWEAVSSTDQAPVSGYEVHRDGVRIATTTATRFVDTGVRNGVRYAYRVAATGAGGRSALSSEAVGVPAAPAPALTVTSPNGGERWEAGSTRTLQWSSSALPGTASVRLELLRPGSARPLTVVSSTPNDGAHPWVLPAALAGGDYALRVVSRTTPAADTSDAVFTVPAAAVAVQVPNGGEVWEAGSEQVLRWTTTSLPGASAVRLELLRTGATRPVAVLSSTQNDGTHAWVVPAGLAGGTYRLQVSSRTARLATDGSDAAFTVPAAAVTVTSPDGGEAWTTGSTQTLTWSSVSVPRSASVRLELVRTGSTRRVVVTASTRNDGEHGYAVPAGLTAGEYRLRVSTRTGPLATDTSDGVVVVSRPAS